MRFIRPIFMVTFIAGSLLVAVPAVAQDFKPPQDYVLKKASDYEKYEDQVVRCIDYLHSTSPNEGGEIKAQTIEFLLAWIQGAPDVTITVDARGMPYLKKNPFLLIVFMTGWTKYAIENEYKGTFKGHLAGLQSVTKYYKKFKENGLKKDKKLEKLLVLEEKGELKQWLHEQIND